MFSEKGESNVHCRGPGSTVFITDYAWPDVEIERKVIEGAGFRLVAGPATPAPAATDRGRWSSSISPPASSRTGRPCRRRPWGLSENLRIIGRLGVGLDNIAVDEATRRGIWVTNVPDYCFEEVADHSVGMLLSFTRGLMHFDREVKAGRWEPSTARLLRMSTLTVGIVGYGRIGRSTAQKLNGFGARRARVHAHSRSRRRAWSSLRSTSCCASRMR